VNRAVARAAEARRVFVNAVDDPLTATAYCGGVLRRAGAVAAISTEGRAPALAALLREAIDALLPVDLERWIGRAEELRGAWKAERVAMRERKPLLLQALNELYAGATSTSPSTANSAATPTPTANSTGGAFGATARFATGAAGFATSRSGAPPPTPPTATESLP
jgi:siroheme synthase-like protein